MFLIVASHIFPGCGRRIILQECLAPLAADAMAGFVFAVDGSEGDGVIDFVSESVRDHLGSDRSAQQIRGQSIFNFLHREDHARYNCCE